MTCVFFSNSINKIQPGDAPVLSSPQANMNEPTTGLHGKGDAVQLHSRKNDPLQSARLLAPLLSVLFLAAPADAQDDTRQRAKQAETPLEAIEILGGVIEYDEHNQPVTVSLFGSKAWTEDLVYLETLQTILALDLPNAIDDDGMQIVKKLKHLEALSLSQTRVGDEGLKQLTELKGLRVLLLAGSRVTDDGLALLKQFPQLTRITLPNSTTDAGMQHVLEIKSLENLDLRYTQVTDETFSHLDKLENLTQLDIGRTRITAESIPAICRLSKLKWLRVANAQQAAPAFHEFAKLTNLELLWTPHTQVDTEVVKSWAPLTKLRVLNINNSMISDETLPHLAPFKELRELYISDNSITPAGVLSLPDFDHLEELTIITPHMNDEALAGLAKYKTLKVLRLRHAAHKGVTDEGIAKLRAAIPGLKIQ